MESIISDPTWDWLKNFCESVFQLWNRIINLASEGPSVPFRENNDFGRQLVWKQPKSR